MIMKTRKLLVAFGIPTFVAAALFLLFLGCEKTPDTTVPTKNGFNSDSRGDSSEQLMKITTPAAGFGTASFVGQQISFAVADGTEPFGWTSAIDSNGTVTVNSNDRSAIYTVAQVAPNTVTVRDGAGYSLEVPIHAVTQALKINPLDPILMSDNASNLNSLWNGGAYGVVVNFQVTGGTSPYGAWQSSNPQIANIDAGGTATPVCTLNHGTNWITGTTTISITDTDGNIASTTLTVSFKH
jgi:hypothetical protein